jgi:hypothetical protein
MDFVTIGLGSFVGLYGLYMMALRLKNPNKLGKLEAMREKFGSGVGTAIHLVAYTVLPVILGVMLIIAGSRGVSVTQFISN